MYQYKASTVTPLVVVTFLDACPFKCYILESPTCNETVKQEYEDEVIAVFLQTIDKKFVTNERLRK